MEDRDYEDRVREGDEAFDAEEWTTAKAAYEAALQIGPEERYPNRLRRLESLMEDVPVDVELDVDTESLLEADAQQAEQERLAADRMAQEQADLLSGAVCSRRGGRAQAGLSAGGLRRQP